MTFSNANMHCYRGVHFVVKIRSYGSKDWPDDKVTRLFLDAYQDKDFYMARMIRDRDDYEEMTPHQLFAKVNSN